MDWTTLHATCVILMFLISGACTLQLIASGTASVLNALSVCIIGPVAGSMLAAVIFTWLY